MKVKIFRKESLELSSFIQLKIRMAQMEITSTHGVKAQNKRFVKFQDYLQRCLWVAGEKRGEWPKAYDL